MAEYFMKKNKNLIFNKLFSLFLLLIIASCSKEEIEVSEQNLVERNGIIYEINSTTPFDGISLKHHSNGQIELMTSIKDGVKDGSQTLYYQNGQLIRSNNYKNGEFHGVQKKFSKSGVLEELENYKNGKTHGVQELYLEGRISIRSHWTDGEVDSDPEFYDKDGNLIIDDWNSLFPEPIQEIPKKVQE